MRISTLSLAAVILLGIGLLSSSPPIQLPTVVAQVGGAGGGSIAPSNTPTAPTPATATPPASSDPSPEELARKSEAEMMAKLEERMDVDYADNSLFSVVEDLREKTGLQLLVDHTAKQQVEAHYSEINITLQLQKLPVRRILSLILDQYELTYIPVEDGLVTITTRDSAEGQLLVRVYNCRDILYSSQHFLGTQPGPDHAAPALAGGMGMGMPGMSMSMSMSGMGSGGPMAGMHGMPAGMGPAPSASTPSPTSIQEYRAKRLMNLLTTTVNSSSWEEAGGSGSASEFDGLIVINQTAAGHRGIDNVLKMLRTAAEQTEKTAPLAPADPSLTVPSPY